MAKKLTLLFPRAPRTRLARGGGRKGINAPTHTHTHTHTHTTRTYVTGPLGLQWSSCLCPRIFRCKDWAGTVRWLWKRGRHARAGPKAQRAVYFSQRALVVPKAASNTHRTSSGERVDISCSSFFLLFFREPSLASELADNVLTVLRIGGKTAIKSITDGITNGCTVGREQLMLF